jgi:hypothetical protein
MMEISKNPFKKRSALFISEIAKAMVGNLSHLDDNQTFS